MSGSLKRLFGEVKGIYIKDEDAEEISKQYEDTKWAWLRKNQLYKIHKAGVLVADHERQNNIKYDIVVNMRMDVSLLSKTPIRFDDEKTMYALGGWPNLRFMDRYLFDGFVYGNRDVMSTYYDMHDKVEDPYTPQSQYSDWFEERGANIEYQLETYLRNNGIKVKYNNPVPPWSVENMNKMMAKSIKRETRARTYKLYNRI